MALVPVYTINILLVQPGNCGLHDVSRLNNTYFEKPSPGPLSSASSFSLASQSRLRLLASLHDPYTNDFSGHAMIC